MEGYQVRVREGAEGEQQSKEAWVTGAGVPGGNCGPISRIIKMLLLSSKGEAGLWQEKLA